MLITNDLRICVAIIASGERYQLSASMAAATYRHHLPQNSDIAVYLPDAEAISASASNLAAAHRVHIRRFKLKLISPKKFTSQLKCQGFLEAISAIGIEDLLLLVDADTYCLGPLHFDAETVRSIRAGQIGMVPDVKDRHTNRIGAWWYIPRDRRLVYVNSGVILTGRLALPVFRHCAILCTKEWALRGPFNDQTILNYVLGKYFPRRLYLLDKRFNGMPAYLGSNTLIGHCAGGAGRWGEKFARTQKHHRLCVSQLSANSEVKRDASIE